MNDLELKITSTRKATLEEVKSLIWGTGALSWPWWGGVEYVGNGVFDFRHCDEESDEGAHDKRTLVSAERILEAAGEYLSEGNGGGDARDAIAEDIGYLDAAHADCILQRVVLGREVFA